VKLLAAPAGGVVCLGPDVKKAEIRGCCLCGWLCFVVLSLPRVKVPAAPQTADDEGAINQQHRSGAVGRTKLRSEVPGANDDCGAYTHPLRRPAAATRQCGRYSGAGCT